jgi:hypothetical protein
LVLVGALSAGRITAIESMGIAAKVPDRVAGGVLQRKGVETIQNEGEGLIPRRSIVTSCFGEGLTERRSIKTSGFFKIWQGKSYYFSRR